MARQLFILGTGGHACVCADSLQAAGQRVTAFLDIDPEKIGGQLLGLPIFDEADALRSADQANTDLVMGLGSTGREYGVQARLSITTRLQSLGWTFTGVRHPSAIVAASAHIAADVQLMARSVVQPQTSVASHSIINTGAIVEHHSIVGEGCHISIGAILCGDVRLGRKVHVGAGSVIRQGISIGDDVIIGAGAAVVRDQLESATLLGVPARKWGKE
jgi:sugar O-acyltransferase (sialic acid O-acetyltransferase NeuD family)